jgi:hypothetical protein
MCGMLASATSRHWAEAFDIVPSEKASSRRIGLNRLCGQVVGNPVVRKTTGQRGETKYN